VNLSSGVGRYPWPRFLIWDVLGEATWVTAYVGLGVLFSDRVRDLASLVSSLGWLLLALVVAVASGWELVHEVRRRGGAPARS
jgi:membrane protein DedA with SNARE-associated domain